MAPNGGLNYKNLLKWTVQNSASMQIYGHYLIFQNLFSFF